MKLTKLKNIEYYKFYDLKNIKFLLACNQTITCQAFWTIKVIMEKNYFRVHVYYACTDFLDNTAWLNSKQLCSNNDFDISNHMYMKREILCYLFKLSFIINMCMVIET